MSIVAQFKWTDVICAYDFAFRKAFTDANKQKLYFSFEEKVEGLKDPWMLLSFLDGMLQDLEPLLTPGLKSSRICTTDKIDTNGRFTRPIICSFSKTRIQSETNLRDESTQRAY